MFKILGFLFLFFGKSVLCVEYIPVLLWESGSTAPLKNTPALQKISTEAFRDFVSAKAAHKDLILLFAEENLSVEDLSWKDEGGQSSFSQLDNLTAEMPVSSHFLPAVESPLEAVQQAHQWEHLPLSADLPSMLVAKKQKRFVLVHLDDASDTEDRLDMLQRHDSIIADAIHAVRETYDRILVIYSGYHSSWVPVEESVRRVRSLLQAEENVTRFINADNKAFFYSSANPVFYMDGNSVEFEVFTNATVDEGQSEDSVFSMSILYDVGGDVYNLTFKFPQTTPGYWSVQEAIVSRDEKEYTMSTTGINAPYRFSYHCSQDIVFSNVDANASITFKDFQIEPLPQHLGRFSDAYDCVWFFTIPIWSGLAVTILLLLIMSSGVTMITGIKTMDRFDDPKGKTITITATD